MKEGKTECPCGFSVGEWEKYEDCHHRRCGNEMYLKCLFVHVRLEKEQGDGNT